MAKTASSRGSRSGVSREVRLLDDEGQGHAPVADADLHGHGVVLQQQLDLLPVVIGEQIGAGEGGAIGAGIGQAAIGRPPVRQQVVDADGDAEIGVAAVRRRLAVMGAGQELLEAVAHALPRFLIDLADGLQRGVDVAVRLQVADMRYARCQASAGFSPAAGGCRPNSSTTSNRIANCSTMVWTRPGSARRWPSLVTSKLLLAAGDGNDQVALDEAAAQILDIAPRRQFLHSLPCARTEQAARGLQIGRVDLEGGIEIRIAAHRRRTACRHRVQPPHPWSRAPRAHPPGGRRERTAAGRGTRSRSSCSCRCPCVSSDAPPSSGTARP